MDIQTLAVPRCVPGQTLLPVPLAHPHTKIGEKLIEILPSSKTKMPHRQWLTEPAFGSWNVAIRIEFVRFGID
jgi:hypothetical protein